MSKSSPTLWWLSLNNFFPKYSQLSITQKQNLFEIARVRVISGETGEKSST